MKSNISQAHGDYTAFPGLKIKNALYGVLPEGLSFVASPRFDEFRNEFYCAFVCSKSGWKEAKPGHVAQIVALMKTNPSLEVENFRGGKLAPSDVAKERKKWAKEQSNPDCIRVRKCKVSRSSFVKMEHDYMKAGRCVYGNYIDTGKKRLVHVSTKMVEYMDGPGTGLRPLDTGCFIGSGHKIKFAKAPQ